MSPLHDWAYMLVAIGGLTLTTVATRGSFFMLPASFEIPGRFERALRFAPACALTAIIAPGVFTRDQQLYLGWDNLRMWALIVAAAVFTRTRSMLAMMGVGMLVFTALRLSG